MTAHEERGGIHYIWCIWCRCMVPMTTPHKCVNTTLFPGAK